MNQIINIDFNKHIDQSQDSNNKYTIFPKGHSYKKIFNIQFFLSIIAIIIISSVFLYYKISLNDKEDFSNLLINNYSITQLYSDNSDNSNNTSTSQLEPNNIIGIIDIPVLNISYPIFNGLTDELLKTSPCKFFGDFPSTNSNKFNLCIAGHNYVDYKLFSRLNELDINDLITIYDLSGNFKTYKIYDIYFI